VLGALIITIFGIFCVKLLWPRKRPHDPIGKCWCLEVHALPPYPTHFPAPPPLKKPEVLVIYVNEQPSRKDNADRKG
jgi:hypothetical protein